MTSSALATLFTLARTELAQGKLTASRIDDLERAACPSNQRQRLLYLHVKSLSILSPVLNATLYEPDPAGVTQIDPSAPELPFQNVRDALFQGWRIVHFPDQRMPFDDREMDILGYEFILEKLTLTPSPSGGGQG